ncbi:hypothetical protein [Candidatus Protochlamydia sp. R18]|uniref:hypothetical protein n=1 Tax=Candidatus Protochlamydia sp. R18 TaxID=1353977 RepID=UPI0005A7B04F|nr:hypothetical protein [Candidatus Protochlamydia sp. R18]
MEPLGHSQTISIKTPQIIWKVKRYDALLEQILENFKNYLISQESLLNWIVHDFNNINLQNTIIPIIKHLFVNRLRKPDRSSSEYLNFQREHYKKFLKILRTAVEWSELNRNEAVTEHVFAFCHILYTETHFNHCTQIIFRTFIQLGTAKLSKEKVKYPLPYVKGFDKHRMVRGLEVQYQRIASVDDSVQTTSVFTRTTNSLIGYMNGISLYDFDPNMQSNPMHLLMNLTINIQGQTFCTKNLALGSPTIENGSGVATINPEMRGLLSYYRQKEVECGLLYLNYQNCRNQVSRLAADEKPRCLAIHDLGDQFKEFYVLTLSHNSPFYEQIGHDIEDLTASSVKSKIWADLCTTGSEVFKYYLPLDHGLSEWVKATLNLVHTTQFDKCKIFTEDTLKLFIEKFHHTLIINAKTCFGLTLGYSIYQPGSFFKKHLITEIFDGNPEETGYWIPQKLVEATDLRNFGIELADHIHSIIFHNRDDLSPSERRIFLSFFYNYLTNYCLIRLQPKAMAGVCKGRIDRGVARMGASIAEMIVLKDQENDPQIIEFFEMLLLVRSLIVRKRVIKRERLLELIEFLQFLHDHKSQVKKLFKVVFPDVSINYDLLLSKPETDLKNVFEDHYFLTTLIEIILPDLLEEEKFLKFLIEFAKESTEELGSDRRFPKVLKDFILDKKFLNNPKKSTYTLLNKLQRYPIFVKELFKELIKRDILESAIE